MTGMLRRLNQAGMQQWRAWLEQAAPVEAPFNLLHDGATSEPVGPPTPVLPLPPVFDSRYHLGCYLVKLLKEQPFRRVALDSGLWDWLSLRLIDQICPKDAATGARKIGEFVRYAFEASNHQKRARHLVRTAWWLVYQHAENSQFMLCVPPYVHGDMVEQLANRQELIASKSLIAAAHQLYWDGERQATRRGAATRSAKQGGTVRRLVDVAGQFKLTYDLDSMSAAQIVALLPPEFDRWRRPTGVSTAEILRRPEDAARFLAGTA